MSDRSHIAEVLKEAREQRGLSVELAATQSGIPLRYVQLLEGETTSVGIPDEFYLIPFFRKYAGFVGLEVDSLLPEFLGQVQQVPTGPMAQGPTAPGQPFKFSIDNLWRPTAIVLSVALAAFLMIRNSPEPVAIAADPGGVAEKASAAASEDPEIRHEGAVREAIAADAPPPVQQVRAPQTDPVRVEPLPVAGATGQAPADATDDGARELHIVATETVWLEVGRDDGPGQEYWLEPGDTRTLRAHDSFSLKVGNAGGVALAFDGRPLPSLGASGQVVRVRLPHPIAHASGG